MQVGLEQKMMSKNPISLNTSYKISYIESAGNYVIINYLGRSNRQVARYKIRDIEKENIDSNLIRIHNRYIVNINYVQEFKKQGRSQYVTLDDTSNSLPVSTKYEAQVRLRLQRTLLTRDIIYTRNDPGYPF